jgi:membrane protease YdiL (CAAX protease family)
MRHEHMHSAWKWAAGAGVAASVAPAIGVATRLRSMAARQLIALMVPPILIITMYVAFRTLTGALGFPRGYFAAFVVYWALWCGALPIALVGPRKVADLLAPRARFRSLDITTRLLILWPIVFPLTFAFIPRVGTAGVPVLIVSTVLGIIIGVTEEVLWRGVYVSLFGESVWLASIYPSVAFGLWHACPLSVVPSRYPGGVISFAAYSVALGLSYAMYARRARSIFWCTVSHCVHDTLGLGGFAYVR